MLIGKLMDLGPGYQMDKRSGRFQSLVTDGIEYMEPYFISYIPQIFIVAFSLIPLVIYLSCLNGICGLIAAASSPSGHLYASYF